jgi:hypothetical protein
MKYKQTKSKLRKMWKKNKDNNNLYEEKANTTQKVVIKVDSQKPIITLYESDWESVITAFPTGDIYRKMVSQNTYNNYDLETVSSRQNIKYQAYAGKTYEIDLYVTENNLKYINPIILTKANFDSEKIASSKIHPDITYEWRDYWELYGDGDLIYKGYAFDINKALSNPFYFNLDELWRGRYYSDHEYPYPGGTPTENRKYWFYWTSNYNEIIDFTTVTDVVPILPWVTSPYSTIEVYRNYYPETDAELLKRTDIRSGVVLNNWNYAYTKLTSEDTPVNLEKYRLYYRLRAYKEVMPIYNTTEIKKQYKKYTRDINGNYILSQETEETLDKQTYTGDTTPIDFKILINYLNPNTNNEVRKYKIKS